MANYEQEEDADIALQRILDELQDKFEDFFNTENESQNKGSLNTKEITDL